MAREEGNSVASESRALDAHHELGEGSPRNNRLAQFTFSARDVFLHNRPKGILKIFLDSRRNYGIVCLPQLSSVDYKMICK